MESVETVLGLIGIKLVAGEYMNVCIRIHVNIYIYIHVNTYTYVYTLCTDLVEKPYWV
jgi:hypothetical protein